MSIRTQTRILVVENDADSADILAVLLRMWGYDAVVCYEGAAALAAANAYRPHVVLLDIGLPGMDGFQVARRLRKEPGLDCTWVIGVTGYGDKASRARAVEVGFDHYLLKPVAPDDLQHLLARVVGLPALSKVHRAASGGRPSRDCEWGLSSDPDHSSEGIPWEVSSPDRLAAVAP